MNQLLNELEEKALTLPVEDRAALAEHLLATLDLGEDVDAEEEWLAEAERRYREYRSGRMKASPAAEAIARVRRALQSSLS